MTSGMLVLTEDFSCSVCSNPNQHGQSISIRSGVGDWPPPRCQNYPDDVKKIQEALNRFSPDEGGPTPPLSVDGIIGNKTKAAIYHFQNKWGITPDGSEVADGVVDVKGYTLRRLSAGPGRLIDLPTEFADRIPRVLEILTATRAAITLARSHLQTVDRGGLPSFASAGKAQVDKLDRHFRIRQTGNPMRRLNEIEEVYLNMQRAVGHIPMGLIVAAEEPANTAVGSFMFTFMGGYSRRNPNDNWNGIHKGKIYLCPKARRLGRDSFAYGMIHELAHYVGPVSDVQGGPGIDDWAYFHKDPLKFKNLPPELSFKNADSYSQYAFDVIGRPDFSVVQ